MFYTLQNTRKAPTVKELDLSPCAYRLMGTLEGIRDKIYLEALPEEIEVIGHPWQYLCHISDTDNPTRQDWLEHIGLTEEEVEEENEAGGNIHFPEREELTPDVVQDMAAKLWDICAHQVRVYEGLLDPIPADAVSLAKTLTGLTLAEFADALGVSESAVRNWITGRNPAPYGIAEELQDLLEEELGSDGLDEVADSLERLQTALRNHSLYAS